MGINAYAIWMWGVGMRSFYEQMRSIVNDRAEPSSPGYQRTTGLKSGTLDALMIFNSVPRVEQWDRKVCANLSPIEGFRMYSRSLEPDAYKQALEFLRKQGVYGEGVTAQQMTNRALFDLEDPYCQEIAVPLQVLREDPLEDRRSPLYRKGYNLAFGDTLDYLGSRESREHTGEFCSWVYELARQLKDQRPVLGQLLNR